MKKRLIGTLLLGALLVSSTSMFVSCKDYDDDINNVSDRVTVLEAAKVDLENKIATLRADLEANYATKVALADTASKERARALAAEASLSSRIQTAQDAIDDLNTLIGGDISKSENFADCKTYKAALEKTWAKIESVESGLGSRLTKLEADLNLDNPESKIRVYLKTLENQIAALEAWQKALNEDGGAATKNWVGTKIAEAEGRAALDAATKAAQALSDAKDYTDQEVLEALKKAAQDATNKANTAEANAKDYAELKANAAQAAAEAYAKKYADQKYDEAITEAQKLANAAKEAAQAYADQLLTEAKSYADQKALDAETNAKAYADIEIATAIQVCEQYAQDMRDEAKAYTNQEIENLKKNELQALSDRINNLQDQLNVLDMIAKELRGLVFIPESYYLGIEAMTIHTLNYYTYTWLNGNNHEPFPAANADTKEKVGYVGADDLFNANETNKERTVHARYDSTYNSPKSRVLNFVAKYHMNPSSANLANVKKIEILDADRNYVTRSSAAELSCNADINKHNWENGILSVNIDVKDLSKIKSIVKDNQVTTFATKVTLRNDTTITSDYAAVYKDTIENLRLAHANLPLWSTDYNAAKGYVAGGNGENGGYIFNTHCGKCALDKLAGPRKSHLMATVAEAAAFAPQDSVDWDKTLDLTKLVELHFTNTQKAHSVMSEADLAANGLKIEYELTGYFVGTNNTSESAQAAIKDGILRPQMPTKEGKGAVYGETDQDRSTIGRTPIVRVKLVDADNNVLDYGYIRIKITETKGAPVPAEILSIVYTGPQYSWSYTGECVIPAGDEYTIETNWVQTQYDIYKEFMAKHANISLSREEFEAIYKTSGQEFAIPAPGTTDKADDLDQYNPVTFTKLTTKIGKVSTVNELNPENGQVTSVLKWTMTAAQARDFFVKDAGANATAKDISACPGVAVLYEAKKPGYPDFFVVFKAPANGIVTVTAPKADVDWDAKKINEYWYAQNSTVAGSGKNEIHANTITPEDNDAGERATVLDTKLADVFEGNNPNYTYLTNLVVPENGDFGSDKVTLTFIFDKKNDGKEYVGVNGKTYVTRVNPNNNLELQAAEKVTGNLTYQKIAEIVGAGISNQVVQWNRVSTNNGTYYESSHYLLNAKAHNDLVGQVEAFIGLQAINYCQKQLPLNYEPFAVRFLRPINVFKAEIPTIEDANKDQVQTINLRDLVKLTDWRDRPFTTNDWRYYGISQIAIVGAENGVMDAVKTNLNQADANTFKTLSAVTNNIVLTYNTVYKGSQVNDKYGTADSFGTLTYKNNSNTVGEFDLKFQLRVSYYWGYVVTEDIVLHVNRTVANAARLAK